MSAFTTGETPLERGRHGEPGLISVGSLPPASAGDSIPPGSDAALRRAKSGSAKDLRDTRKSGGALNWFTRSGAIRTLRAKVSKKKKRFRQGDFDLDLTYITPRIIAMGFPSSGSEQMFRNPMSEVQRFFDKRHPDRCKVYNLCSERSYDASCFGGRVSRYAFDDHNPSRLEQIPQFCADVDAWLAEHPENVVAVHCKAGKGRTGQMIAAYLLHSGYRSSAESSLRWFGFQRTANGQGVTIPSQMRFVHYYEQVLHHGVPPVFEYRLLHVRMRTVPNAELGGGCVPFFVASCNGDVVCDYRAAVGKKLRKYRRGEPFVDFDCTRLNVVVRGNVKFQFLHETMRGSAKLCHIWFHTGFVSRNYLAFNRSSIDGANKDKRGVFLPHFGLELYMERIVPAVDVTAAIAAAASFSSPSSPPTTRERHARSSLFVGGGRVTDNPARAVRQPLTAPPPSATVDVSPHPGSSTPSPAATATAASSGSAVTSTVSPLRFAAGSASSAASAAPGRRASAAPAAASTSSTTGLHTVPRQPSPATAVVDAAKAGLAGPALTFLAINPLSPGRARASIASRAPSPVPLHATTSPIHLLPPMESPA